MPVLDVVVEQLLAPVPGGTGRYARQIAAALARHAPDGWRVRTLTAWHRDVSAAHIPEIGAPHRLPAGHRVLAEAWMRGLPPTPRATSVHGATPLMPTRARRGAVTVHDVVPWTHPETLTPRGVAWHRRIIERSVAAGFEVVVPTRAVGDALTEIFPQLRSRLQVIGHGVTSLPVPGDAADRRVRLGLPERYLVTVATLEPRKGLDVLIAALAVGEPGVPPVVAVGQPGWGGVSLAGSAAAAGLAADRVIGVGRIDDADLAAVLDGATALVAPSRAEGFGLPVLEAMAAGLPVICSDDAALVEVAGGAAVVVPRGQAEPLAQAMAAVCDDADRRARLRAAGLLRAADFSWQDAAERLWRVHRRLAEDATGG